MRSLTQLSGAPEGPGDAKAEAAHFGTARWGCAGALGEREMARVLAGCWAGLGRGGVGWGGVGEVSVCVCVLFPI